MEAGLKLLTQVACRRQQLPHLKLLGGDHQPDPVSYIFGRDLHNRLFLSSPAGSAINVTTVQITPTTVPTIYSISAHVQPMSRPLQPDPSALAIHLQDGHIDHITAAHLIHHVLHLL